MNTGEFVSLVMKIILLLAVCFSTIHTLFMVYHWYTFGQDKPTATIATIIYLSGLAVFFLVMTGAVFTYTSYV